MSNVSIPKTAITRFNESNLTTMSDSDLLNTWVKAQQIAARVEIELMARALAREEDIATPYATAKYMPPRRNIDHERIVMDYMEEVSSDPAALDHIQSAIKEFETVSHQWARISGAVPTTDDVLDMYTTYSDPKVVVKVNRGVRLI